MISASTKCRIAIKNNSKAEIKGKLIFSDNTVVDLTGGDFMANTLVLSQASSSASTFDIGSAIIGKASFVLNNYDGKFDTYDFTDAVITLWIGIPLPDETREWIKKGVFTIEQPDTYGNTISLSAYDNLSKLEKSYADVATSYPSTLLSIASDICLYCGVQLYNAHFDNYNLEIAERPDDSAMTCLDVISYIAQIAGSFAACNTDGALTFKWYDVSALTAFSLYGGEFDSSSPHISGDKAHGGNFTDYSSGDDYYGGNFTDEYIVIDSFTDFSICTDDVVITGIKVMPNEEKVEYSQGSDEYQLTVSDNPFVTKGNADFIAKHLGGKIIGLRFRPFSAKEQSDPTVEPGDCCHIMDRAGNIYQSVITSLSYGIGKRQTLSCGAEAPGRNRADYYSDLAKTASSIRKNQEEKLSNYDKQVQAMNQLAVNAMGFYQTVEIDETDGSQIVYMHDKPSISDSKIVYKETIDGFFLSQDGGRTYVYGRDSSGNAVVNILSSIGIICDWIKGGTLVLGGDNNVNGEMLLCDSNGNIVGRWNNSGMNIYRGEIEGSKITLGGLDNGSGWLQLLDNKDRPCCSLDSSYGITVNKGRLGGITIDELGGGLIGFSAPFTSHGNEVSLEILQGSISGNRPIYGTSRFSLFYAGGYSSLVLYNRDATSMASLCPDGLYLEDGHIYAKSLSIFGTKNRIADTESYSKRLLYCYEMPKPYFGDIGEATLDSNGLCYIFVDDIFLETINTDCKYQVFLQKYGTGDIWIKERTPTYFTVEGTPNLPFAWELKARQMGYEAERLETFVDEKPEETIDYEIEAENYIENYYKEILNYEESN